MFPMNTPRPSPASADPAPSLASSDAPRPAPPETDPTGWYLGMLEHFAGVGLRLAQSLERQELLREEALRCQVEA